MVEVLDAAADAQGLLARLAAEQRKAARLAAELGPALLRAKELELRLRDEQARYAQAQAFREPKACRGAFRRSRACASCADLEQRLHAAASELRRRADQQGAVERLEAQLGAQAAELAARDSELAAVRRELLAARQAALVHEERLEERARELDRARDEASELRRLARPWGPPSSAFGDFRSPASLASPGPPSPDARTPAAHSPELRTPGARVASVASDGSEPPVPPSVPPSGSLAPSSLGTPRPQPPLVPQLKTPPRPPLTPAGSGASATRALKSPQDACDDWGSDGPDPPCAQCQQVGPGSWSGGRFLCAACLSSVAPPLVDVTRQGTIWERDLVASWSKVPKRHKDVQPGRIYAGTFQHDTLGAESRRYRVEVDEDGASGTWRTDGASGVLSILRAGTRVALREPGSELEFYGDEQDGIIRGEVVYNGVGGGRFEFAKVTPPTESATVELAVSVVARAQDVGPSARDGAFHAFDPVACSPIAGRYQVLRLLGQGHFSRCYEAFDQVLDRRVALKVCERLTWEQLTDLLLVQSRLDQLDEWSACFPSVLGAFWAHERWMLVEEVLGEQDLWQLRTREPGYFGPDRLKQVARWILDLVSLLHAHQIIHCDLKPDNIVLASSSSPGAKPERLSLAKALVSPARSGCSPASTPSQSSKQSRINRQGVKIVDFGCARFAGDPLFALKEGGAGHASVSSPEVLLGLPAGPELDCWAVGMTLCMLLTGRSMWRPQDDRLVIVARIQSLVGLPTEMLADSPLGWVRQHITPDGRVVRPTEDQCDPFRGNRLEVLGSGESGLGQLGVEDPLLLDFLTGLLDPSPAKRLTAQQALQHPYLEGSRGL